MLRVPLLRQPDHVSWFPAAVCAVLQYLGHPVEFDQVAHACGMGPARMVQEMAVQGLSAAGFDIRVLNEFEVKAIQEALNEDQPAIISLQAHMRIPLAHAVVVCELDDEQITVMDPLVGDYVQLDLDSVRRMVGRVINGVVLVSGAPPGLGSA